MSDSDPLKDIIEGNNAAVAAHFAQTGYADAYIAFLDVLGMQKLVSRNYRDLRKLFNVGIAGRELYSKIKVPGGGPVLGPNSLRMTIMSDSIVLSIAETIPHAFSKMAGFSSYLVQGFLTALDTPVYLRGGMTRGEIFQDDTTVFGPGLVDAYKLENDVAKNMRCIASPALASDDAFIEYTQRADHALTKDPADDMYFIKFARPENYDLLEKSAESVLGSDLSDNVKAKYQWLADYVKRERSA